MLAEVRCGTCCVSHAHPVLAFTAQQGASKNRRQRHPLFSTLQCRLTFQPALQGSTKDALHVAQAQQNYPELEKIVQSPEQNGSEEQMEVVFRDVNTFSLWLWFEFYSPPSMTTKDLLETVLESWFVIGRLGGFNGMNLQVSQEVGGESSHFKYDASECDSAMQAVFMDLRDVESQGHWCRCWVNMGTADELALDVLINAMSTFSRENVGIKQMIIGGKNADWDVPEIDDQMLNAMKGPEGGP